MFFEYLECNNNGLKSLDVSSNANLITLICSSNELTELIVSQNTALNYLECNNNALTSLDVSQNPALNILTCSSNNLTTLDLSSNTNLEILSVDNNQLETLDIRNGNNSIIFIFNATNNPNLSCIFVDNADYSSTNWTTIDAQTSFSENCAILSVPQAKAFELQLYPNPTSNLLFFSEAVAQVQVYDLLGKLVLSKIGNLNQINLSALDKGVYLIHLNSEKGTLIEKDKKTEEVLIKYVGDFKNGKKDGSWVKQTKNGPIIKESDHNVILTEFNCEVKEEEGKQNFEAEHIQQRHRALQSSE